MSRKRNTPVGPVGKDGGNHRPPSGLRVVGGGKEIALHAGSAVRIGRGLGNDVILADEYVSEFHCVVERFRSALVVVKDLSSTNGTYVNGMRVKECELVAGASVRVGGTLFAVAADGQRLAAPASEQLLGADAGFRQTIDRARQVAATDLNVIILGETGTGKELVARLVHEWSPRAPGPFVALNCAAIPRELVESELYGHEKGAFTGASERRVGLFEQANGGTLFLDEVGELGVEAQARLLRALETRRIRRVGGASELEVDVRFVAATHRDLRRAASAGGFRPDLFHRLNGAEVHLPPLRERREDIPILLRAFLGEEQAGALSPEAWDSVVAYPWPGNVRELKNAAHRAAVLGERELRFAATPESTEAPGEPPDIRQALSRAIDAHGSYRRAAAVLKIPKSTLHERARRLGVRGPRDRG